MFLTQPNMQADEDRLAAMFSKNMSLDPVQVPQQPPKIVYISQHYTHTAHLTRQEEPAEPSPRHASEPAHNEHMLAETVLRNHGVDPSCLSNSQLQLFKTAEEPQQLRLIELWRICPPTDISSNQTLAFSSPSTMEVEMKLAQDRYLRSLAQPTQQDEVMSLDGTTAQYGDGTWVGLIETSHYMEPYMSSGYDEATRMAAQAPDAARVQTYKPSTDPVYNGTCMVNSSELEKMENQYGRTMDLW
jgi:hypothetical protein